MSVMKENKSIDSTYKTLFITCKTNVSSYLNMNTSSSTETNSQFYNEDISSIELSFKGVFHYATINHKSENNKINE